MAETLKDQHENHESYSVSPETAQEAHEKAPQRHESEHKHNLEENIEQIRHKAEKAAIESDKTRAEAQQQDETHAPKDSFVNKELKDMAYARTMNRVRQQLSPVGRKFSKLVHQPVVDTVSEGVAKTVGRTSGLFGGGLVALVGTSVYYWISKHYGYDYNFLIYLMLLAGGFVVGWLIEMLWNISRRGHHHQ
jgi:flagellar biosynthesis GTPase FlhF